MSNPVKFSKRIYPTGTELQHATRQMNWCLFIVKGARGSIRHFSYVMGRVARNKLLPESTRVNCEAISHILYELSGQLNVAEDRVKSIISKKEG